MECIFCNIVSKKVKSEIIYENDDVIAFNDIHPKAPVHTLLVPKTHIPSVNDLTRENCAAVATLFLAAPAVARKMGVGEGYKLAVNVGRKGGQVVDHLHLHLLGADLLDVLLGVGLRAAELPERFQVGSVTGFPQIGQYLSVASTAMGIPLLLR